MRAGKWAKNSNGATLTSVKLQVTLVKGGYGAFFIRA